MALSCYPQSGAGVSCLSVAHCRHELSPVVAFLPASRRCCDWSWPERTVRPNSMGGWPMTTNRGPLPGTPGPDNPEQGCLPPEVKMLRFAATGEQLDLGKDPFELPAMKAWAEERTIRASVLRQLLVDQQWPVHARGVRLRGLRISGHLDLEAVALRCPLHLEDCYLDDPRPVVLNHARPVRIPRPAPSPLPGAEICADVATSRGTA